MFHIFVVDDNPNTRRLTSAILRQNGYDPIEATDGADALKKMETNHVDLILLDIKMTSEEDYIRYTGGSLAHTMAFLKKAETRGIPVWIRQVIVPAINDSEENIDRLASLLSPFSCVERVELLPFRTLCVEKYRSLGIPFPLEGTPDMTKEQIAPLQERINKALEK